MKKRILAAITAFAVLFTSGCGERSNTDTPSNAPTGKPAVSSAAGSASVESVPESEQFEVTPPFFKVTDERTGGVVYMMGSMHVGKPGATYPQKMYDALEECDILAVEVDVVALESNFTAMAEAIRLMMCKNGKTVSDYMGDDYDSIVEKFTEKGLYNAVYEMYIPVMWSSLWSNAMVTECGFDSGIGTDRLLLGYAAEHDMRIDEIESAKEQYEVEANISPELQMIMLNQTLELSFEETKEQFDMLYDAWRTADMETLKQLAEEEGGEELSEELITEYAAYYDAMYTKRQEKMARYIKSQLAEGNKTFVVVGAMHYAAPPDILDFLAENDNYTITSIYGNITENDREDGASEAAA